MATREKLGRPLVFSLWALLAIVCGCASDRNGEETSTDCTRVDSAARFSTVLIEAAPEATPAAIEDCKRGSPAACAAIPIATPFIFATGVLTAPVFFLIGLGSEDLERNMCGPGGQGYQAADSPVVEHKLGPTRTWEALCRRADAGDGTARSAIAALYRDGWGPVRADGVKAYQWFTLAIESGDEPAKGYRDGLAAELTAEQVSYAQRLAASWQPGDCRREVEPLTGWSQVCPLAMREDARAQFELGAFFEYGKKPVERDLAEAYLWYALAAERGYGSVVFGGAEAWSMTKLDALAGKMTEDQIDAAEERITGWRPDPAYCAKWPQVG